MRLFCPVRLLLAGTLTALPAFSPAQNSVPSSPAGGSTSQDERSHVQAPLFRATTNLVTVDVVVTRNGHPIKGLGLQAFHVLEDGREQTIKVFEEHAPASDAPTAVNPTLPRNTYSNTPEASPGSAINVLLLDAINTPAEDQAYARHKIIEYLKTIPPGTRMAVFTLASRLRLVQGFTSDSSTLLAALNKTGPITSPALPGNKGESASDRYAQLLSHAPLTSPNTTTTQPSMYSMVQSLQQFEADEDPTLLDRRIQITLDALRQLALYLGALPGRKNVIWFSASFPIAVTPDFALDAFKSLRSYAPQLQQISDLLTASRVAVYPVDARGLITTNAGSSQGPGTVARGAGVGRGVIDVNAFPTAPSTNRTDAEFATMLQLADQTGGTPFYNSNALKQALAKAIDNGANYYTLAYSPEDNNFDGKFRKIQIKLAEHDYHLAYRRGYYAEPVHSATALLSLASPGLQAEALAYSQILFRAHVVSAHDPEALTLTAHEGPAGDLAAKLKPPVTRYWVEFTADMHQVSAESGADGLYRSTMEFIVIAYDRDGKLVNASRRSFKLGIPPAKYEEVLQSGYTVRNEIDLPEGDFWLRLAVHDVSSDRIGSIGVPAQSRR